MAHIITRAEWGAQYGRGNATSGAKTRFIVHHDGREQMPDTASLEDEIAVWRRFEHFHRHVRGWDGIAYSFGIMPYSGRIFEGRGWGRAGAHTPGLNTAAYAVCFPMNGDANVPSAAAVKSFNDLRMAGIRLGHLTANHVVSGHRDHDDTTCPGDQLYALLVLGAIPPEHTPTIRQMVDAKPTLRKGKGGDAAPASEQAAVRVLQRRLFEMQELPHRHITGYFGDLTEAAVLRLQRKYRLPTDGIVGPLTYKVLGL